MKSLAVVAIVLLLIAIAPAAAQTGIVTGMVTSANNAAVPDATVTLSYADDNVAVDVPNNPQFTTNYSSAIPGMYTFINVPYGRYNVTAEKDGYSFYATINVTSGTATANVVIPENITVAMATSTPQPYTRYYTYVPVKVTSAPPQATTTRSPGFDMIASLGAFLVCLVAIKARRH